VESRWRDLAAFRHTAGLRYARPDAHRANAVTERRDEPVSGEVIEGPGMVAGPGSRPGPGPGPAAGSGPAIHAYRWEWSNVAGPAAGRTRLPWLGIFLVVFGVLLLAQIWFPALATAGSILFLAIGVAFLVSWAVNRGTPSLYLGAIIVALAAPGLLAAAGLIQGPGVGTLCLGIAFLAIAAIRWITNSGVGWQAILGGLLVLIGLTMIAFPGFSALVWPLALVIGGVVVVGRSYRRV
jgi:hypothetical protein